MHFEPNIIKACHTQNERYPSLVADINNMTLWSYVLICLEVGSGGLTTKDNKIHIKRSFTIIKEQCTEKSLTDISVLAASSSDAILVPEYNPVWFDSEIFIYVFIK